MKSKTIETGVCTLLVVEVPEGAFNITDGESISFDCVIGGSVHHSIPTLPLGNWQILCKVSEVTDDFAKMIVKVGRENFESWDYEDDFWGGIGFSPEESFQSLLRANGIDWDKDRTYIFKLVEG